MTSKTLNALTRKELAQKAKRKGIEGWHGMRKHELVEALLTVGKRRNGKPRRANGDTNGRRQREALRRMSFEVEDVTSNRDQLTARVLDQQWIELTWSITRRMIERAEASLGTEWHDAIPVVRVTDVTVDEAASERTRYVKDVPITGGSEKWFVPIEDPSRTYCLHLGFLGQDGGFFSLAHTRKITLPKPSSSARLERPGSVSRKSGRVPIPAVINGTRQVPFVVEAELVVHGSTHPNARLSILGQPVETDDEGHFSIRVTLPEGRQVIPVVSLTPGGDEQRTIVLAIERNTKTLEPESLVEP